jgi:Heparinase II/III-like protein/Heparinase II/III N-terminus
MQLALQGHGIRSTGRFTRALSHPPPDVGPDQVEEIISGCFFGDVRDESLWAIYRAQFADSIPKLIEDAETICRHEFNLLGSGPCYWGSPIDWHLDPVSGYRWPKRFFIELRSAENHSDGKDIKVPWELSRMQHLPTLGKAYRLTKDERYAQEIVGQLSHWLDDNPCPYGVNWTCAMDVAIRAMNMIWAYLFIEDSAVMSKDFSIRLRDSFFQHGQFILFNLEHGVGNDGSIINSNHYLANIVGLLHLGLLCPTSPAAETWRNIGITALVEEMDYQVYSDGGDFESSIPYHRLALELFLAAALLCRTNGVILPTRFWAKLEKMFEFILFVTRPDGKVPQIGDADDGRLFILSDYGSWDRTDFRYLLSLGAVLFQRSDMKAFSRGFSEEAFWLLGPSGLAAFAALQSTGEELGSTELPDSGLYVMRVGDKYLLACCGKVGTGGLGNHKHNDLLSFEIYAGDKGFIVDPGAYVYSRDPNWRNLFRSTQYHNSVVIDGQEQNRFEAGELFTMAADATVLVHGRITTPEQEWLEVEHTGYSRLAHPVRHTRTFVFDKQMGVWEIMDGLAGDGNHTADWYFHFDHGIELEIVGEGMFQTRCMGTNLELIVRSGIPLEFSIEDGWISRRYGHKWPAKILHISGAFTGSCCMTLKIRPLGTISPVPRASPTTRNAVLVHESGLQDGRSVGSG